MGGKIIDSKTLQKDMIFQGQFDELLYMASGDSSNFRGGFRWNQAVSIPGSLATCTIYSAPVSGKYHTGLAAYLVYNLHCQQ